MIDIRVRCDDWKMMSVWFDVARKNGYADDRAAMIRDALACLGLNLAVIGALFASFDLGEEYGTPWDRRTSGRRFAWQPNWQGPPHCHAKAPGWPPA